MSKLALCRSELARDSDPKVAAESGKKTGMAESTKGSRSSPLIFVVACSFFIIEGRSVVVFGNRYPLPLFLAIPIRDQEQTYFFER
ncbi:MULTISPECIES: hypothetical protein [Pseudomonas]|uniref:hypothetical protein n=1 Tax=Pseudomonas TaxID=286 RepID=UPI0012DA1659|nr:MULTISPECIES: hypothetical protein [Pseudomonas]MBP5055432.1 hypothetical protein [Pseudomonas chlororaphis]MBP5069996.1 hypothetical protein [Pseudomonas chlororaphis]MBP5084737.1 hypothetical protein [Pseudomonas chlororaphis]MBP5138865.1 hypothetical protein [Pseudomonas chlororaphis]QTT83446.1 hypothetical protein HUT29_19845 [Pseudomonas chlororaphis]